MIKLVDFFRKGSSIKLILLCIPLYLISVFIEKSFPSIFLGLRMITFILFVYAVVRYFSEKRN
jgi:Ca2+/H+ antiporter